MSSANNSSSEKQWLACHWSPRPPKWATRCSDAEDPQGTYSSFRAPICLFALPHSLEGSSLESAGWGVKHSGGAPWWRAKEIRSRTRKKGLHKEWPHPQWPNAETRTGVATRVFHVLVSNFVYSGLSVLPPFAISRRYADSRKLYNLDFKL